MSLLFALLLQAPDATSVAAEVHRHFVESRWEEAVKAYARMPEPPPAGKDADGFRVFGEYRSSRAPAHWQAAQAYARLERWGEALTAFREAQTHWRRMTAGCGNAFAAMNVEETVAEGICLERLGRHAEALAVYVRALRNAALTSVDLHASRIVELHSAVGDLDGLAERMVVADAEFVKAARIEKFRPELQLEIMKYSPGNQVRPFLAAARRAAGPWTAKREVDPLRLPFPPLPADLKLR